MLVDSNILIYATKPEHAELRQWLLDALPKASIISKVEILGYHKLQPAGKVALTELLNNLDVVYLTPASYEIAIQLRQQRKLTLGIPSLPPPALSRDIRWQHATRATSHGLAN